MKHYNIITPLHSHHIHNEHRSIERIISQLQAGAQYALVSDAG